MGFELLEGLWPVIEAKADEHGLDPVLVGAVVMAESGGDTWAARFEPHVYESGSMRQDPGDRPRASSIHTEYVHQATSWGLMQVMGFNVRAGGFLKGKWLHSLCDPAIGLEMGCRHLAGLTRRWDTWDAVSAYNQGSPRKSADGSYQNQAYVNHVKKFHGQIQQWRRG